MPDRLGRHEKIDVVRELRVDRGASTTLGFNEVTREYVVLRKLDLSVMRPWSWDWLGHELDVLARTRLPHHVTARVISKSANEAVLIRPFVPGRDMLEWAAHEPRPSIEALLQLTCELLYALAGLHRMGIAHGGVKPANIILTDEGNELVLLDASATRTQLAANMSPMDFRDDHFVPADDPGIGHRIVGFGTDIYAAGRVLLEAIAESNRTSSALRCDATSQETPAGLIRSMDVVGVPRAVRSILVRLLNSVPGERYESAEDALAAIEAVLATGSGKSEQSPVRDTGFATAPFVYVEPPLIGRCAELETLNAYVDRAARSAGGVLCMSGESGVGKSRLLNVLVSNEDSVRATILRGGAFEYTAQRPLGLFAEPFRNIVAYLGMNPDVADHVRCEMGELIVSAVELIPGLAEIFSDLPAVRVSGGGSAAAAPVAVARLFQLVFSEARPGVVVVDDCQWADDLSWQVLARMAWTISCEQSSSASMSLICSFRPEAVAQVKNWGIDSVDFLDLQPLSSADTEDLVRSIGERIPDEVVPYVVRNSFGNPLETLSVFRALIDSSALVREADGWVVDEDEMRLLPSLSQSNTSGTDVARAGARTDVFVSARFDLLSAATQQAMRQGAVLGRQFPGRLLRCALEVDREEASQFIQEGTDRGILRYVAGAGDELFEFTHDRVRNAVLRSMTEDQRRRMHLQAAQVLGTSTEGQSDFEIAYHLERSGQVAAAFPYALRAGEAGLRQHALDVAESNFQIAEAGLQLLPDTEDRDKFRAYEGLGSVHMLLASYDLAAEKLGRAYEIANVLTGLDSARVAISLGELAFKTGRFEDSAAWMHQGMRDLGLHAPANYLKAAVSVVFDVCVLIGGRIYRRRGRRKEQEAEYAQLAARIFDRLTFEWWFVRSPLWVWWAAVRGVRFAEACGSTRERWRAHSMAATIAAGTVPIVAGVALRISRRCLRLCKTTNDDWHIAHAYHLLGFVLHAATRYDQAIAAFDTAIAAFDRVGDRWEQIAATWQKALCLFRRGRLHEAGVLARETYREASRIGDRTGAGTALTIWVRCLPTDVSVKTIEQELRKTNSGDHHTTALLHAAHGWRLFIADQHEYAVDAYRKADESLRRSGIRNHFVAPIVTAQLQVLRVSHGSAPAWCVGERRIQAKATRRQLFRALRTAAVFRAERPTVLREWAIWTSCQGRSRLGRLMLRIACRSAAKVAGDADIAACSAIAELTSSTAKRGVLGRSPAAGGPCRRLGVRVDRGVVETVPSRVIPTGTDLSRHRALLDAVSSMVGSSDVEEVLAKLREATIATTTARRVEIAQVAEHVMSGALLNGQLESSSKPVIGGEAVREMKRTDRVEMAVLASGHHAGSIVAAFPLGDGDYHEPTVEVLAALAGAVIERESLRRESTARIVEVQEAERGRIARDLHDEFGHLFAGIMDGLHALQEAGGDDVGRVTMDVRSTVRQGIQTARAVAWSLRPSGLDDLGLFGCIEQFVEDCRRTSPIRIELASSGSLVRLESSVETAIFRIVQEALTNVGRHSNAAGASVMLMSSVDAVRAIVEDDGVGFDADLVGQRRSLGLFGMQERARLVGGRLTVDSQPGRGTTVVVEVPLRP